jgi:hypothetical protein
MEYILTEEEYKKLVNEATDKRKCQVKWSQELCTFIADTMPTFKNDYTNGIIPWKCIKSIGNKEHYCDKCPVREVCPNEFKNYSK